MVRLSSSCSSQNASSESDSGIYSISTTGVSSHVDLVLSIVVSLHCIPIPSDISDFSSQAGSVEPEDLAETFQNPRSTSRLTRFSASDRSGPRRHAPHSTFCTLLWKSKKCEELNSGTRGHSRKIEQEGNCIMT